MITLAVSTGIAVLAWIGLAVSQVVFNLYLVSGGWDLRYLPELTAYHRPSGQNAPKLRHLGVRNTLWFAWRRRHLREDVIAQLKQLHPGDPRVAVYPYAGMQHQEIELDG